MKRDKFELRKARMRYRASRNERQYLNAVLSETAHVGGFRRQPTRRFNGAQTGRGSVAARALMSRDRHHCFRTRGAFAKTRLVYIAAKGTHATRLHLYYIQRDGVGRDGNRGPLYSSVEDKADGNRFLDACRDDRHGFRLVLSADDATEYDDLRPLVRRFMARMEEDLGTRLEWVATDHFNTAQPHTHVVLRGKDDHGENLVIAPDYIRYGMRARLAELLSVDLGPKTDFETGQRVRLEINAERLTSIDRRLLGDMDPHRIVAIHERSIFDHAMTIGRLCKLEALGLAKSVGGGSWRLSEALEPTLCTLGQRSDILRTLRNLLSAAKIDRAPVDQVIFQHDAAQSIAGRVVTCGFADEISERRYLVVDGIDGRCHYVETGKDAKTDWLTKGAIVRVTSISFADAGGNFQTQPSKSARLELLSPVRLEQLPEHDGATWLDRELASPRELPRDAGFGRMFRRALEERRAWLIGEGLASPDGRSLSFRPDMLEILKHREILSVAARISRETGLEFAAPNEGTRVEGIVRRRLNLTSGSFALIDNGWQFSLVPWQSTLEPVLGRSVEGVVSSGEISWTIDKSRGIEI